MKKIMTATALLFLVLLQGNVCKVSAYSVKVEEDGMYAKYVPASIMKNVGVIFQKEVRSTMKYYNKYKDADEYTRSDKIPKANMDFMDVAKSIQDTDEITICHPFYIYRVGAEVYGDESCYFVAKKNEKTLCIFSVYVDLDSGKVRFNYDKMLNRYFDFDQSYSDKTLYFSTDTAFYAATPDKTEKVRDMSFNDIGVNLGESTEDQDRAFYRKTYDQKKKIIFNYLEKSKSGKTDKQINKTVKANLKEDYITPEEVTEQEQQSQKIYMVVGILVGVCVCVAAVVLLILKKRSSKR